MLNTSRMWRNPPRVWAVANPRSHNAIRIAANQSIVLRLLQLTGQQIRGAKCTLAQRATEIGRTYPPLPFVAVQLNGPCRLRRRRVGERIIFELFAEAR